MNIMSVDVNPVDVQSGQPKSQGQGDDLFAMIMASMAVNAGQPGVVNLNFNGADGEVHAGEVSGSQAGNPVLAQVTGITLLTEGGNDAGTAPVTQAAKDGPALDKGLAVEVGGGAVAGLIPVDQRTGEVAVKVIDNSSNDNPSNIRLPKELNTENLLAMLNVSSAADQVQDSRPFEPKEANKVATEPTVSLPSAESKDKGGQPLFQAGSSNGPDGVKGATGQQDKEFKQLLPEVKEAANIDSGSKTEVAPIFAHYSTEQVSGTTVVAKEQAHHEIALEPADLISQVSDKFKTSFKGESGEVKMELHPESLGHLKIEIKVEGGVVRANIVAENTMVKETIDSNLPVLRRSLEDQGLRIDQLSVGVDQRQGGNSFAQREQFHIWQSFNETGTRMREDDKPVNEPIYQAGPGRNEGVSIFA